MSIIFNPLDPVSVAEYYMNVTDFNRYQVFQALTAMSNAGNPTPLATYLAWLSAGGEADSYGDNQDEYYQ